MFFFKMQIKHYKTKANEGVEIYVHATYPQH
jgi:hypothetical protein